jgi:hypothetical protein
VCNSGNEQIWQTKLALIPYSDPCKAKIRCGFPDMMFMNID